MKTIVPKNINRLAFEIVRTLSAPFITLLVILLISARVGANTHSNIIAATFIIVDILAVVGYLIYTIYTIFYIDKYHKKNDTRAPKWFIALVKGLTPIYYLIYNFSLLVASRLKVIENCCLVITLLVNYKKILYKIEDSFNAFISSQTEILYISDSNYTKSSKSKFQEEFESLNPSLLYAIIEYLRSIKEERTMYYGCMIQWLKNNHLLTYNAIVPTHIHNYFKNTYNLSSPHRTNIQEGMNYIEIALMNQNNKIEADKISKKYLECYGEIAKKFDKYL